MKITGGSTSAIAAGRTRKRLYAAASALVLLMCGAAFAQTTAGRVTDPAKPSYVRLGTATPPTAAEIPPNAMQLDDDDAQETNSTGPVVSYEKSHDPPAVQTQLRSLQEFVNDGDNTSSLGIQVREERRSLKSGGEANGLLIISVVEGSPAAQAGLHAYRHTASDLLQVGSVVASIVFPPAILAVPVFEEVHIGDSYDLIIGVDGNRVTNFLDFEDTMREVRPGEIVYLSVVRDGSRMQIPVHVPTTFSPPVF